MESLIYKDQSLDVAGYVYSECDTCGQDIVTAEQMKVNQLLIADVKRRADGLLTSTEIKALRRLRDVSQADAGKVFGGGPNAFYKYENGEVMQSVALDRLMVLARDDVKIYQRLRVLAGLPVAMASQNSVVMIRSVYTSVFTEMAHANVADHSDIGMTVQAFLGAVSNQAKPLISNVTVAAEDRVVH